MNAPSRLLPGLCASVLLLSLAACGGDDGGATAPAPAPTEPALPAQPQTPQLRCAP